MLARDLPEIKEIIDRKVVSNYKKTVLHKELLDKVTVTKPFMYYQGLRLLELAGHVRLRRHHQDNYQIANPIVIGWVGFDSWRLESLDIVSSPPREQHEGGLSLWGSTYHYDLYSVYVASSGNSGKFCYPSLSRSTWGMSIGIVEAWQLETYCRPLRRDYPGRWIRETTLMNFGSNGFGSGVVTVCGFFSPFYPGQSYENHKKAEFMNHTICNFPEELTFSPELSGK